MYEFSSIGGRLPQPISSPSTALGRRVEGLKLLLHKNEWSSTEERPIARAGPATPQGGQCHWEQLWPVPLCLCPAPSAPHGTGG